MWGALPPGGAPLALEHPYATPFCIPLLMAFWGLVIFVELGALPIPCPTSAKVAELVDAQDLGSCGLKAVGVRVPPFAFKAYNGLRPVASEA